MKPTIIMIFLTLNAGASTFVGNGGGQGDIELAASKKQLIETFEAIKKTKSSNYLCKCTEDYQSRSVCEPLRKLTESQRKYCQEVLFEKAPELLKLVQDNDIKINWTHEKIEVKEGKTLRAVDAVTNPDKKEITVNLPRFLSMKTYDRIFLLSHEYLHLTKVDGKPLTDEGAIGPFTDEDGGRQFLNAMGSAVSVLEGELPGISAHKGMIRRSRATKKIWLELGLGGSTPSEKPASSFGSKNFSDVQVTFRYFMENFGIIARIKNQHADKKILGNEVEIEENVAINSLGVAYRIFPFADPLTYWGQSHILLQAQHDWVKAKLEFADEFTSFEEEVKTTGLSASASYYIPFFWGIWWHAGIGAESHPYQYSGVNLKYKGVNTSFFTGVAYGF